MKNSFETGPEESQDEKNEKMGVAFMRFIREGGYDSLQMREAYNRMSGRIASDSHDETAPSIIHARMETMVAAGFPVEYLDELIEGKIEDEQSEKGGA